MKISPDFILEYLVTFPPEHVITLFALYIVLKVTTKKSS